MKTPERPLHIVHVTGVSLVFADGLAALAVSGSALAPPNPPAIGVASSAT